MQRTTIVSAEVLSPNKAPPLVVPPVTTEDSPVDDLLDLSGRAFAADAAATVEEGVKLRVSEHVRYGWDTFDRVSYSVEVTSSVRLVCPQSDDGVQEGKVRAQDAAWTGAMLALEHVVPALEDRIRKLYPSYPWDYRDR